MANRESAQTTAARPDATPTAAALKRGSGMHDVQSLFAAGSPEPQQVANVIALHPTERDQIMAYVHSTAGNAFAQQIVATPATPATPPTATADKAKVADLLQRLGVSSGPAAATTEHAMVAGAQVPATPVADEEVEGLSPQLHAQFAAKLTAGIDPKLVAAIKAAGGMVLFMKAMAAGTTVGDVNEAAFEQMWNNSADEAWLKDKFRAVDPSMHEWIPSNQIEAIVEKPKTAPGGASWIDLQNELRSPTNQVIFKPAKSSSTAPVSGGNTLVLHGHVGAIYLDGVMQTKDEATFHDELRAAFTASKNIANAVDLLKAVMVEWMWDGDKLPETLDPQLQDSVKKPIDEQALIAQRAQHFSQMSSMFDALKAKYGGASAAK